MPLLGRPLMMTGPIWSPALSCETSGERTRSGPRPPVASSPWQKAQFALKVFWPRSTPGVGFNSALLRRCLAAGACPSCDSAGSAASVIVIKASASGRALQAALAVAALFFLTFIWTISHDNIGSGREFPQFAPRHTAETEIEQPALLNGYSSKPRSEPAAILLRNQP